MTNKTLPRLIAAPLVALQLLGAAVLFSAAWAQVPPPVPALPDAERRTQYSISASTCTCSVGFALYGDSTDVDAWIEVWIAGTRYLSTDPAHGWSLSSATGTLATIPRPITNAVLTFNAVQTGTVQIVGARRPRRAVQVQENGGVPARAFNQSITDIVAVERELWDKTNDVTGRAVLAPAGETLLTLPAKANRLNQGACFDTNGNLNPCVSVPGSTFTGGAGITFTGTNPTTISANLDATLTLNGSAIALNTAHANNWTAASTTTLNSLSALTLQDAASSQDKLTQGVTSSSACDPAYLGGAVAGPCSQINMAPNATGSWNTLNIQGTNTRTLVSAIGGAANPEMVIADTNVLGVPVWNGGNQAGAGFVITARTGANAPAFFNLVNVGANSGTPSGAEGSMTLNIWSGSSNGQTQGMVDFFNATGCTKWSTSTCSATQAGSRLGEIAGNGMSADGIFTQTETGSINFYAQANWSGTHIDGSYQAPTNIVFRTTPNSLATQRTAVVMDSNTNLLVGPAWSATSAGTGVGAIYARGTPANIGAVNMTFNKSAEQGLSIQNSAGDTGSGSQILFQNVAGGTIGSVSGTATTVAYNTTSDRRLKTNIVPESEGDVGSILDRLRVVNYAFTSNPRDRHIGFIAQDEYRAFPDAVTPGDRTNAKPGDRDFRPWERDDSKLVPLLVAEVQALRRRVKQLEYRK